jgi:very-short-patch-repair endonuclease
MPPSARLPGADAPPVAAGQGGAFTRIQARAAGWTDHQIQHRIRTGIWVRLVGRSLVCATTAPSPLTLAWGAQLAVPEVVISHLTAGMVLGFPLPGPAPGPSSPWPPVHVITDRHRVPLGLIGHRSQLAAGDITRWSGLTLTATHRTALDCLAMLAPPDAVQLWAWLVSRRILATRDLAEAVRERFGQQGTPALLQLLRLACSGAASVAERKVHTLLRGAGIGGWAANAPVHDDAGRLIAMADVLFARSRLILEIDGYAAHSTPEAFVRDRRRQNALVNAGYRVLRITWADLIERPHEIIAEIEHALAR